jgi:hypothetical protein
LQTRCVPGWQWRGSTAHIEFAATPSDNAFVGKPQLQPAKRDLKSRCRFIVADEKIRHAQCERIKRAT